MLSTWLRGSASPPLRYLRNSGKLAITKTITTAATSYENHNNLAKDEGLKVTCGGGGGAAYQR